MALIFRCPFATLPSGANIQEEVPSAGRLLPASAVSPRDRVRAYGSMDAFSGDYSRRNGHCRRAKLVGAVDRGYFRGPDLLEACVLTRRGDLQLFGPTPCVFRRLFATLTRAESILDDAPPARNLRPASAVAACTPRRKNGSMNAFLGNDRRRDSDCWHAELAGDLGRSYFRGLDE